MKEPKQSFLERLTGTRVIGDDQDAKVSRRPDENILSEKPWSPRVDDIPIGENKSSTGTRGVLGRLKGGEKGDDEPFQEEEPEESEEDETPDEAGLAIDMYTTDNELIIQSMIAGVTPENLHITITRDAVTLSGKRVAPHGIPEGDYLEHELYWGKFSREIKLPFEIDTDGAEAVEKYGLLIIRLPKLDTTRTQELKVTSI